MNEFKNPGFFPLIKRAVYIENEDFIQRLYTAQPYLTDQLHIKYIDDIEILEYIVRILSDVDVEFGLPDGFVVIGCPDNKKEYVEWFIKLFALLSYESSRWNPEEVSFVNCDDTVIDVFNSAFISVDVDPSELQFVKTKVNVSFISELNYGIKVQNLMPEN